jgi:hypothetical protein
VKVGVLVTSAVMKKSKNYRRGQALVEMTLILPMLLTLTLGAVELANIIYTYQVMHHLTAQGANMASRLTPPTTLNVLINKVIDAACPVISQGSPPPATCPPENLIKWRVIYTQMGPDTSQPDPKPYVVLQQRVKGSAAVDSSKRICANCVLEDFTCDPSTSSCIAPNNVPSIGTIGAGQTLDAFEVFYDYSPITVLGNFVGDTFTAKLYERSIF